MARCGPVSGDRARWPGGALGDLAIRARSRAVNSDSARLAVHPEVGRSEADLSFPISKVGALSECPTIHPKVQPYQSIVARSGRNRIAPLCSSRVAVFIASRRRASGDLTH